MHGHLNVEIFELIYSNFGYATWLSYEVKTD